MAQRHKLKTINLMGCRMTGLVLCRCLKCQKLAKTAIWRGSFWVVTMITWMYSIALLTAALVTSKLKGLDLGGCRSVTSFGWQLPSACLHDNSCVLEVLDLRCNSINENRWLQLGVHYVAILIWRGSDPMQSYLLQMKYHSHTICNILC